jgi:adenosylcobinamide-phosphate synthase
MSGALLVFSALLLDTAFGDPRRLWHPVRLLGTLANVAEVPFRLLEPRGKAGSIIVGGLAWATVVGAAGYLAWSVPTSIATFLQTLLGSFRLAPRHAAAVGSVVDFCVRAWFVYVSIAPRDLAEHAWRVARALRAEGEPGGRREVAMIVGRDVDKLDLAGIVRATVESVAESSIDGVIAPLFWALLLGPAGAFAYRAANTLDSMWGHRDERYETFGKVAARADDVANWLPARIGAACAYIASLVFRKADGGPYSPSGLRSIAFRDGGKHASPNSGVIEAAFAGALGIQLAGPASYSGVAHDKPYIGDDTRPAAPMDIDSAIRLMYGACLVFCAIAALLFR